MLWVSQIRGFALASCVYIGRHNGISPHGLESLYSTSSGIIAMAKSPIRESGGNEDVLIVLITIGHNLVHLLTCRYFHVWFIGSRTLTAHCWIPSSYNSAQHMAGN